GLRATSDLGEAAAADLVLLVTPAQFLRPVAAELAARLGLRPATAGPEGEGAGDGVLLTSMPNYAIVARFADPKRAGLPLLLSVAANEEMAAALVHRDGIGWLPSADLYQMGDRLGHFRLEVDGSARPESWIMFAVARPATGSEASVRTGELFELRADSTVPSERLDFYTDTLGEVLNRIDSWAGAGEEDGGAVGGVKMPEMPEVPDVPEMPEDSEDPEVPDVVRVFRVLIDGDLTFLAGQGAGADLWRINPVTGAVQTVLAPGVADDGGRGVARARLRHLLGQPRASWLEDGAALDGADSWWGRDLEEWVAFLRVGELLPSIEELLAEDSHLLLSPHRLLPARGALFRALRERDGAALMRARYASPGGTGGEAAELPGQQELGQLFADWTAAALARRGAGLVERRSFYADLTAKLTAPGGGLFQGVGLVPPGNDLTAPNLSASLAEARAAGADSFTLRVSFTKALEPWPGLPAGVARRLGTIEGDALVAGAIAAGRGVGLAPVLALEVLTAPSGNRSGERKRTTVAAWDEFFADVGEGVTHAGLLAELTGCRIMVIGEGQAEATRVLPQPDGRDDPATLARRRLGWEQIIARARAAFTGGLTYGARWPMQARGISFWEQLDFVGVELLAPLRDPAAPGEPPADGVLLNRLQGALVQSAELAAGLGKSALVVEVGFPASSRAFEGPGLGLGASDPAEQERLYGALARVLRRAGPRLAGLAGVTLWSWPPALEKGDGPAEGSDSWRPASGAALAEVASILSM
ncbi:MAG: hypothetical protein QF599_07530, partial [Planctomycetota bacterium]|nr:hypothetical protein [Planctomycetota bacterium]